MGQPHDGQPALHANAAVVDDAVVDDAVVDDAVVDDAVVDDAVVDETVVDETVDGAGIDRDAAVGTALERFEALARRRRTSLLVDAQRPVDDELLDGLCRLATWAPNHHRTWPWRFAVLVGDARARLGAACAEHLASVGAPEAKVTKARGKYLRAPAMIVVASAHDDDPATRAENRDAVAAGVQTLLLAATAAGLASFWGTGVVTEAPAVRALCGFGPDDDVVAAVYLGWPTGEVPTPERPSAIIYRP